MFCCFSPPADSDVGYVQVASTLSRVEPLCGTTAPGLCSTPAGERQSGYAAQGEPRPMSVASTEQPMLLGAMPVQSGKNAPPGSECVPSCSISPAEDKPEATMQEASARDSVETPEPPLTSDFVLSFETEAGPREVVVAQRPLGLTFHKKCPVVIESVAGHADELRIQEGWTLTHFDGIPVQNDFEEFHVKFVQRVVQKLPGPALLPLLFQTKTSALHTVVASCRPVGLTFFKRLPVEVKAVAGHSRALGVQPGWTLVSFGETQTMDFAKFDDFIELFQESLANLTLNSERS